MKHKVYLITNKVNGQQYCGKTSQKIQTRLKRHFYAAKTDKKVSYLHRAMNKYGHENFTIDCIASFENEADALDFEMKTIKEMALQITGYNILDGGGSNGGWTGKKHTQKAKDKMSKAKKGMKLSESWKNNIARSQHKGIIAHPLGDENSKMHFASLKEAAKVLGIKDSTYLSRVAKGKRKSAFGYVFRYTED